MSTTIHVRGVAPNVNLQELKELFEKQGVVDSLKARAEGTNPASQSVFVVMLSSEAAQHALTNLNGKDFAGRKLSMQQAALQRRS